MAIAKLEEVYAGFKASFSGKMARMRQAEYAPPYLCTDGSVIAAEMAEARIKARDLNKMTTKVLLKKKDNPKAEAARQAQINKFINTRKELATVVLEEPDALASLLVANFCTGIKGMEDFDNQRRVVMVWSAILLPCVVIRERDKKPITATAMIDAALSWIEYGYTAEARMAFEQSKTSAFAKHPSRIYKLLSDTAGELNLDHGKLMVSMILPLIGPLACFEGMASALDEAGLVEGLS